MQLTLLWHTINQLINQIQLLNISDLVLALSVSWNKIKERSINEVLVSNRIRSLRHLKDTEEGHVHYPYKGTHWERPPLLLSCP